MSPEVTLTRDRVLSLFESNPMSHIRVLDVNLTFASIAVAVSLTVAGEVEEETVALVILPQVGVECYVVVKANPK